MCENKESLDIKYERLRRILEKEGRVAVAFSGGTDSTLLLRVASDVLKDKVLAITALSETTPRHEREEAIAFAKASGVRHLTLRTHELDLPEFSVNPPNRCYICKKYRFGKLTRLARQEGFPTVVDGENTDDLNDYRPGRLASQELGIRSPLQKAGLSKAEVRELARQLGLSIWNKPSSACLASRIPYHSVITAQKLRLADVGESFIRNLGIAGPVRVRLTDDISVRIEVTDAGISEIAEPEKRHRIVAHFREMGIRFVTLDLKGYRMGSLNP